MTQRLDLQRAAPEGARALHAAHDYVEHCSLPRQLVDLVYLRTSQINGCAYCIDLHSRDLLQQGMSADKLRLVPVWHELGDFFDARERAALAWTESLTRLEATGAPDADYDAAAQVFSERELADLTIAIALMNAYNRFGVGLRKTPKAVMDARAAG
ncbi:MAG: carboxymuconolactone decarboxylase family protein [Comamonadaceae bacterium]|nr:carboxymuconolactone decarboxylase family protein [Burkholderiales bacterium]MEB2347760.1 carboxymuconolactone decarboxylase family protein [Comamonadaceae bacterium]